MSEVQAGPVAIWSGHASIYEAEDGGIVLAYQADGSDEVGHHHVPGMLVKMAQQMQGEGGGLLGFLRKVAGRGA